MTPEILRFDFKQQMETPDELELYIYSEVVPGFRYNRATDEVEQSETSADFFRQKLAEYPDVKTIKLYVNSIGGYVREGYGIYAQLKRHPAYKIGYNDGFACSIASVILMACDKIIARINSMTGIHNAEDYCFGNAAAHRKCAEDLDKLMEGNRQIYLERSGGKITLEKLTELLDEGAMLTAAECMEYGWCDEIAEQEADPSAMAQALQQFNTSMSAQMQLYRQLRQSWKSDIDALNSLAQQTQQHPEEPPNRMKNLFAKLAIASGK